MVLAGLAVVVEELHAGSRTSGKLRYAVAASADVLPGFLFSFKYLRLGVYLAYLHTL